MKRALSLVIVLLADCRAPSVVSDAMHAPAVSAAPASPVIVNLQMPPMSISTRRRAHYFVGTAAVDQHALGGFAESTEVPKPVAARPDLQYRAGVLQVLAKASQEVRFQEREGDHSGFHVVIINATEERQWFDASDSMLDLVQEAQDDKLEWRAIEYRPGSWCGNSRHRVAIDPGQYWELTAPRFKGTKLTRMRFKLSGADSKLAIYSNEFDGFVEPSQYSGKEGHQPTNVMDPYRE